MGYSTYSFLDVNTVISHPSVGVRTVDGEGIGEINISMSNDVTNHDVSADGSVMVSKIKIKNGTIALAIQQTSELHKWLLKWYNYITIAPTAEWAQAKIVVRAPGMGEQTTLIGVSPQKLPDRPYKAQGQQVTWNLMAAEITQEVI